MTTLDTRFTHALLMAIIVLLTFGFGDSHPVIGGEIGRLLHAPGLILACLAWAWGLPRLREWAALREKLRR